VGRKQWPTVSNSRYLADALGFFLSRLRSRSRSWGAERPGAPGPSGRPLVQVCALQTKPPRMQPFQLDRVRVLQGETARIGLAVLGRCRTWPDHLLAVPLGFMPSTICTPIIGPIGAKLDSVLFLSVLGLPVSGSLASLSEDDGAAQKRVPPSGDAHDRLGRPRCSRWPIGSAAKPGAERTRRVVRRQSLWCAEISSVFPFGSCGRWFQLVSAANEMSNITRRRPGKRPPAA